MPRRRSRHFRKPTRSDDDRVDQVSRLRVAADRVFGKGSGAGSDAASGLLSAAVKEVARLRQEAKDEWFGDLNTWDCSGSRSEREQRPLRSKGQPERSSRTVECTESFIRRGLEGLLRRRGIGLEFLEYVHRSATAIPEPRWLPRAFEGDADPPAKAVCIILPPSAGYDDRFAVRPRVVRFGRLAPRESVLRDVRALWRRKDSSWPSRPRRGPMPGPWWTNDDRVAWFWCTVAAIQRYGRPERAGRGETDVSLLFEVAREEPGARIRPIHARTYARWFKEHWEVHLLGTPGSPSADVRERRRLPSAATATSRTPRS